MGGEGQKANGYIAKTVHEVGMAVIGALADGSLYTTDIARAEALQEAPINASLIWKCLYPREYTLENYNFCREKLGMTPRNTLPPYPFEAGSASGEIIDAELAAELAALDTE